jgi:hypothetical protein
MARPEGGVSMEKLTGKLRYVLEDCIGCISPIQQEVINKSVDRLAAYEDTGLEPETIEEIYKEWSYYLNFVGKRNTIEDAVDDIYDEGKVDYDRLRELAQADRMIGKEVWAQEKYLNIFQTKPSLIQRTTIQYVSLLKGGNILCHTQTCAFPLNEIGKTVFLTREEAKAALEGMKNG